MRIDVGPDEVEIFDAVFDTFEIGLRLGPLTMNGPMEVVTFGKVGNTTGVFGTEIVSMDLVGSTPLGSVLVRESPSLPSQDVTTITDIGGGLYHIDSFFEVLTEFSIDGGLSWVPSLESVRMTLVAEPASLSLIGLCAGGQYFVRRIFSA